MRTIEDETADEATVGLRLNRPGPVLRHGAAVVLERVSRIYEGRAQGTVGVSDVSLRIEPGSFVALTGPSGSGKSTLLNLVAALDRPSSGRVLVDGADLATLSDEEQAAYRRDRVGIVFQEAPLIAELSVQGNVALPGLLAGRRRAEVLERAASLLDAVGLGDRLDSAPAELSGGQRQRAALARALVNDPPLVVADEPTGSLDQASGRRVLDLLLEFQRAGCTLLLVTHDPGIAALAERRLHLVDGRLLGAPGA